MIDPLSRYTADLPAAKAFYQAGLGPRHVTFSAPNRAAVDTFYNALREAGDRDHGAPGIRETYHSDYYDAFVLDPDDNHVEACCHASE